MKVAVIHDWLGPMTGAERVLDHILACYPGADVFTTVDFLPERHRHVLHGSLVVTSFVQRLPSARTAYWNYIPLMPFAVRRFDLSRYDLIISNSHTVAKGIVTTGDQVHVCYLETPMRFAWDLEQYYLDRFRIRGVRRRLAAAVLRRMRAWDTASARRVQQFVAVSAFVARRCERFYGRQAPVVHPPVDVHYFTPGSAREDFFLVVSRLTPFKRVDLIVEAFRELPRHRLVVIGDGPERARVRALCAPNITYLGYQPDDVLRDYMRRARALLFPAPEDFGIVMAEAQACGTPVIALGHGGACEIVRGMDHNSATGVLFDEATPEAVREAVALFERNHGRFTVAACRENAERFAPALFRDRLTGAVSAALRQHRAGSLAR